LKKRDNENVKNKLISYFKNEIHKLNSNKYIKKNTSNSAINYDDFDINNLNITVKTFTFSLDDYRSNNSTLKRTKHFRKRSEDNVTIRGLFQTSVPGIADANIEKDLLLNLLYEWAPNNLVDYSNISFELTFVNSSKQTTDYEKMVSQQLNGKNTKYDFYMIDSVWTGRYGEHLIDLQGKVSADSVNKFAKVNLDSCKYKNKLTALVYTFLFNKY